MSIYFKIMAYSPFILTFIFVFFLSSPAPLTDEWLFLQNAMIFDDINYSNYISKLNSMRWKIYEHPIFLPNIIYLIVAPIFAFDSRVFIVLTVMCFICVAVCVRICGLSTRSTFLVSLVLASPARYMEFLWGFQFSLAMSIFFPVLGLFILDKGTMGSYIDRRHGIAYIIFQIIGLLSSSPAAFAMVAASFLVAVKPINRKEKFIFVLFLLISFLVFALLVRSGRGSEVLLGRSILVLLTSVGALLFSMPVAITNFGLDRYSIMGGLLLILSFMLFIFAIKRGRTQIAALPFSLIVYGGLMIGAIAVSRSYLGNWHLQCAVPIAIGAIVMADRSFAVGAKSERLISLSIVSIVAISLSGMWVAIFHWGPAYAAYASSVVEYMNRIDQAPSPKPFPSTGGWDVDADMVKFLVRKGNSAF